MAIRDILKGGVNLPLVGAVSIGGILVFGTIIYFLYSRKKSVTLKV